MEETKINPLLTDDQEKNSDKPCCSLLDCNLPALEKPVVFSEHSGEQDRLSMKAEKWSKLAWVEKVPAAIFRNKFGKEIEAFYESWSVENYYEGDGSEYEERYRRFLLAQMREKAESETRTWSSIDGDNQGNDINGEQHPGKMCDKTFYPGQALREPKTCCREMPGPCSPAANESDK